MSKTIDSLTKEQEAMIPEYRERFRQIGLNTAPCDKAAAEKAITDYYKYNKASVLPKFEWVSNPLEGCRRAAEYAKGSTNVTSEEVQEQASFASYGQFEAYWVSTYAFIAEVLPVQKDNLIDIAIDIVKNCGIYWSFEDLVIMCDRPSVISMKDEKLHNPDGPALSFGGEYNIYAVDGTVYPSLIEAVISSKMNGKTE
jgi:hypothetical protein